MDMLNNVDDLLTFNSFLDLTNEGRDLDLVKALLTFNSFLDLTLSILLPRP